MYFCGGKITSFNPQTSISVFGIIEEFTRKCKQCGWKTGEYGDYIKYNGEYYSFVCTKNPEKLVREILTTERQSIFEDGKYKVDRISYKALIFQETPPKDVIQKIKNDLDLSKHVAVYDFTDLHVKNTCKIMRKNKNDVFMKFEEYLRELDIIVKPM